MDGWKDKSSSGAGSCSSERFGQWLTRNGLIKASELEAALLEQQENGGTLGEAFLRVGIFKEHQAAEFLSEYLDVDYVPLNDITEIDFRTARSLPESISRRFDLLAVGEKDDKVLLAMTDPLDIMAMDTVSLKLNRQVCAAMCSKTRLENARQAVYHGSYIEEECLRNLVDSENESDPDVLELESDNIIEDLTISDYAGPIDADQAPVIRFVNLLLSQAVKSRASDIHLEPQEKSMKIRMRIDGVLNDMVPPSRKMQSAVITRIKILSQMNIAERRLPQDGRFKIRVSQKDIDIRVSVIPVIYGEKVVMRILDKSAVDHNINVIGFDEKLLEKFKLILGQPHGIVIITGPTGSGKSTTLYSALTHLRDPRKNITTVEDPVEYRLAGINQIQTKQEIELGFAPCLRAILRQDPDVILIGEIRDKETVEIAVKASLTGHLVLSTFHTNDAPSALTRLAYMGIDRYLLASTVNLVVAQRLVKKICEHCKQPIELSEEILGRLKIDPAKAKSMQFYHGTGCSQCNQTGYKGRTPIFEFMVMGPKIRKAVVDGAGEQHLRQLSRANGYGSLMDSGVQKLIQGITTAEEVLNTTFAEEIE